MDSKSNYRTEENENYSNSIEFSGNSTSNSGCCRNFCFRTGSAKGFETIFAHSSVETKKKHVLTAEHREGRLNFEREHSQWSEDSKKVVFMDEKRFSLDGPDGFQHYWHELRKESKVVSRRLHGGGGSVVWGAIFYYENVKGVIQNQTGMEDFVLQQYNAPTHNSRIVKQWLEQSETTLLPFSSNINVIENVWGWLSRRIYSGEKQFTKKEQLKLTIR
ncbi:hypothetical protein Trydic_g6280 [Trypoxylus dichotomus]